ncbi:hypothetical protein EBME_1594 [bacterium endosymbiont of Mortierella elongata FMR23-6]|nr:hypothetical protein EBME_1594 [bacterium endosymbiont of Mortierella elongata FMR23-6]
MSLTEITSYQTRREQKREIFPGHEPGIGRGCGKTLTLENSLKML